jgi:hypothetical protein
MLARIRLLARGRYCNVLFRNYFLILKNHQSNDVNGKWEATAWAKKIAAKKRRASLTDFERFKVQVAKKQRSTIVSKKVAELSA